MTQRKSLCGRYAHGVGAVLAIWLVGCGGDEMTIIGPGSTLTPTATRTRTATLTPTASHTPTRTPTTVQGAAVRGLVVVRDDFARTANESLGEPPEGWTSGPDVEAFDRALAGADWLLDGGSRQGVTAADGTFTIGDLAPGRYMLEVTKTLQGNLVPLALPLVVGDAGAQVIAEVGLGLVRTRVRYQDDGADVEEIRGPYGNWLITRDGQVVEIGDFSRVLTDADGDGRFENAACGGAVWACPDGDECGPDRRCQCVASCAFCDNCERPGICAAPGKGVAYRCGADGSCSLPGDECTCVPSCPDCTDCTRQVCLPRCAPVDITSITISGPSQVRVARQAQLYATAHLSDGGSLDVTYLAEWRSSNDAVATVDSWGNLSGLSVGSAAVTASIGTVQSAPWSIAVVERPTLRRIQVENQFCSCGPIFLAPVAEGMVRPCIFDPPLYGDILPVPVCNQVVLVGATLRFVAIGEYDDASYEDLTADVDWRVEPATVGDLEDGLFTARQAGTATITATLGSIVSDPTEVRVVTEPTVVSLSIHPENFAYPAFDGGPVREDSSIPCFDCGLTLTVLRGDVVRFRATAHYNTGEWRDVTEQVTWRTSDASIASVDSAGVASAQQAGDATIDATLDGVDSNPVGLRVVNDATLVFLSIYVEGTDRVVAKGEQRFLHATGSYDIGITRDVTADATWHSSDASIGEFEQPGVFTARAAGIVQVWAEQNGVRSESVTLEVYQTSELTYCDPANINRGTWSDAFNRVILESDCDQYTPPAVAALRYTVTETQPHGGIFDPCLDLYVYQGGQRIRTIREEGCGDPFLPPMAAARDEVALKYQLRAFWDLKDETGNLVPAGQYSIVGVFFLYYDPVVSIDVSVLDGSGPLPTRVPTRTPTPASAAALMSLSIAGGEIGEAVRVGLTLQASGLRVSGTQNDMAVTRPLYIAANAADRPDCIVTDAVQKPATTFAFQPPGCRPAVDCEGVRALVFALDNTDPIPDGATVYSCAVTIPQDAMPGSYPVRCTDTVASDPFGQRVAVRCVDGVVRVGGMGPPPTPPIACVPPRCAPDQVLHCVSGDCPGGCGLQCAMPTPAAAAEGACFLGSADCEGMYVPGVQRTCCDLFRLGALPLAVSWCPGDQLDAASGKCVACASSPCAAPGDVGSQ